MTQAFSKMLIFAVLAALTATANAQSSDNHDASKSNEQQLDLPSDVNVTPEMWMYLHEYKRHQDPKTAVRRKAEFRAEQRRKRIASRNWYGQSKLRPNVNANPYFTNYGTKWVGVPWAPEVWSGYSISYEYNSPQSRSDYYYYPPLRMAKQ